MAWRPWQPKWIPGVVIVFRSKRADRVKILLWDTSGLVLCAGGH